MKSLRSFSPTTRRLTVLPLLASSALTFYMAPGALSDIVPRDPGVRAGAPGAGGPLAGISTYKMEYFDQGKEDFEEVEGVGDGLGPRFNLDSCVGCHLQPAVGGSAPATNPQVGVATAFGARNVVPSFITLDGPVREARFKYQPDGTRDGGVHSLFVISGRVDTTGDATACPITQPDFEGELKRGNLIFRVPTPTFGAGLMEAIPDSVILANQSANSAAKIKLGIAGHPNRNGNDGSIARFGWKAQNQTLLLFAAEAYNVEMGISNDMFQVERDGNVACHFALEPNSNLNFQAATPHEAMLAIQNFANFMRFLAPPTPSLDEPGGADSIARGRTKFDAVGCGFCHTPTLTTGNNQASALSKKSVNLFSDLLVHAMGPRLADDIVQGGAGPDEFRTAPLWGLGQRIFFLHDGRTTDLLVAIQEHKSAANSKFRASEATAVINQFNALSGSDKQDLLNFLRSL